MRVYKLGDQTRFLLEERSLENNKNTCYHLGKVTYVMAQDAGTKADCIAKLLRQGYERNHVIMIGDAPGDQQAAERNDVLYFPILAGYESVSWKQWIDEGYSKFCCGVYIGAYQETQLELFLKSLTASK